MLFEESLKKKYSLEIKIAISTFKIKDIFQNSSTFIEFQNIREEHNRNLILRPVSSK